MSLYLGLDSSTQSLTAVIIDLRAGARRVVFESSMTFDDALPQYGTRHGVLPQPDPHVATSSPLMWAEALDVMMARLQKSGLLDPRDIAAVSGSAQQHGSVYLKPHAPLAFAALDPSLPLVDQIRTVFSCDESPIWMDSSTACLLYTSPSPRDRQKSRMPSSA